MFRYECDMSIIGIWVYDYNYFQFFTSPWYFYLSSIVKDVQSKYIRFTPM